ncbi:glycerol-3-phosphate dehydrogenase [Burkholderiales bacterium]|nr:glycerol-3-phosphate dehydrogenase [Burkholderiales bacterium]
MPAAATPFDLLIVGGGINGAGIARDAAGRGLSVLLVEKDDLASATSSWSTKLIHGGLRYLEHYEFRLVAESLAEREVVLRIAPHIVEPIAFVLPHEPHLRPAWMIRAGLFLYDRLGGRMSLPRSFGVDLGAGRWGAGLQHRFRKGFVYSDARVDDARLVVANAMSAREHGADIRVRTRFVSGRRDGGLWRATLEGPDGREDVVARAIVNAGGPWVAEVLAATDATPSGARVRHVKGSHIVVPRVHAEDHAYILQNSDHRIVFVIPYQQRYTLIGTTDVPVDEYESPRISGAETDYLIALANAYLATPLSRADVVWSYSGVRPLYDDGTSDPSAVTRDYVLKVDATDGPPGPGRAPVLSIYGGKITTYRKLAEAALAEIAPHLPGMKPAWTAREALPGGDLPGGDRAAHLASLRARHPGVDADVLRGIAGRHGTRAGQVLGEARRTEDLGEHFGAGLTAREVDYLVDSEWARRPDDVLWRRTKCGLPMTAAERERAGAYVTARARG